ncbi:MAG: metallophosphoesterase family protein [Candidatus Hodarchaeales archaeon]|jgi:DNA repair exonuclease SbcCD nuclease subunit
MDKSIIRFLHTGDTHLGINLPKRKKNIIGWHRSVDFLDNFQKVLDEAKKPQIDFLLISGDLFDRSKPPKYIINEIWSKILDVSIKKPVFLIPGNHDRSYLNSGLFRAIGKLFVFNKPETKSFSVRNLQIGVSGFPSVRHNFADKFSRLVTQTKHSSNHYDYKILIMHQLLEHARVGVQNYQFKASNPTVLSLDKITNDFDYYALGHIHRFQQLSINRYDNNPKVIYSGSIERTAFQERNESKGYIEVEVALDRNKRTKETKITFQKLQTRPMYYFTMSFSSKSSINKLIEDFEQHLITIQQNALIKLKIDGIINNYERKALKDTFKKWKSILKFKELKFFSTRR